MFVWRLILRVCREPLAQFLVLGAIIFVSASMVKSASKPTVRLEADEMRQLVSYWETQMQRAPSADELQGIIAERIDEEILAQEAIRLGLDTNDLIIRRRLAQKMAFTNEDTAPAPEPSDEMLRTYFGKNEQRFQVPTHVTMRHVFFATASGEAPARARAQSALKAVVERNLEPNGDPFLLPLAYNDIGFDDLLRDYGPDFASTVESATVGQWVGPVQSAFGLHLVRVEARTPAHVPAFDEVRADVRDGLLEERRQIANQNLLARLRTKYQVEIEGDPRSAQR
jgi:hypothetical protein